MIGVTIGVGQKFRELARNAAKAAKKYYRLDHVVVLGDRQMGHCPPAHRFPDFRKRVFWLKFMVPVILSGIDRWIYFDADYTVLREPPADVLDQLHHDPRLIAVKDWWPTPPYPWPYRNAGFYVANRDRHEALFSWCREKYFDTPEVFGDQCVWNAGIAALKIDVLELPQAYNSPGPMESIVARHGYG